MKGYFDNDAYNYFHKCYGPKIGFSNVCLSTGTDVQKVT